MEKDFKKWFHFEPDWKEIAWEYNTGAKYQHKQDLIALFKNCFYDYKQKYEIYFNEFHEVPNEFFRDIIFEFRQHFPKGGRLEGINYFDDLIDLLIENYSPQPNETHSPPQLRFTPEITKLKDWILPSRIAKFTAIEQELFELSYIDNSYKWKKTKKGLIDFLCVIMHYEYFKLSIRGKKIQDFHKRQFISERYGFDKTGLTETAKKYKPTLSNAIAAFQGMSKLF